jgi:dCMP deaminase
MELDEYFIKMARLVSLRGACVRRQVGCILTNNLNHVLATGYNGRARGVNNCLEEPCIGAEMDSGMGLERCEAIHAEANALLQCKDVEKIKTAYCTTAPCIHCVKLLMNTSCTRIVFQDGYPHAKESERLWTSMPWHAVWEQFPDQMEIFDDNILCKHEWVESKKQTQDEDTIYISCTKCLITKEVCK